MFSGFLTLGIPSIKRLNGHVYIAQTVESLIINTTPSQRDDIVIVVFLADFDTQYNDKVTETLTTAHPNHIHSGLLQIVTVKSSFYPPLTGLKRNYNDRTERVTWRAKQVSDYVFLLLYSEGMSKFYMQLEDDIIAAPDYMKAVKSYVLIQRGNWAMLEFSELGFIGKLFKDSDLIRLARYFWTFYEEQPVDWLVRYFKSIMTQKETHLRKPTLFQHMGSISSFDTSKANNLKDRYFASDLHSKSKIDNPPAKIITSLKTHDQYLPHYAYSSESYFWSPSVNKGDYYLIVFESRHYLNNITIDTGMVSTADKKLGDFLQHGSVEISYDSLTNATYNSTTSDNICQQYLSIGHLTSGHLTVTNITNITNIHKPVQCIKITVDESQKDWLILYDIVVNVQNTTITTESYL